VFEEIALQVMALLAARGVEREPSVEGWCWDNGMNRVCLSGPENLYPPFRYMVGREHYDDAPTGRMRTFRYPPLLFTRDDPPERIADTIADALTNPY
jgi:hypothetical protein